MEYANGQGVPKDLTKTITLLKKSADQGQVDAELMLGLLYGNGEGVTQDHSQAAFWFKKAVKQGNFIAQYELGILYLEVLEYF